MSFANGEKKRSHMIQLLKNQPYVPLQIECACQKQGCLNKTTHATWHVNKHSYLLRPLCPKCYEISQAPPPVPTEKQIPQAPAVATKPEGMPERPASAKKSS